jgi:hypothetical protein
MYLAQELINDNGISAIALGFFSMIAAIGVALIQRQRKVENAVNEAAESANQAQKNTENVSNGFTARMDKKLDSLGDGVMLLAKNMDRLEEALHDHVREHNNKETS